MKIFLKTAICMILMIAVIVPTAAVKASAADLQISKTSANVPIGYSVTVKVTGSSNVKWSSDNESVAAVKADGASAKITGKKTGSATISAKVGSTTLKCKVTVKKSFITPSAEKVTVSKGKSKTITLKVSGSKDIAISNSNKDVCSTSWGKWDGNTIKLTVKGKANGNAVIKVYAKNYSKSTTQEIAVNVGKSGDAEIIGDDDITESSDTGESREEQVVKLVNKERKAAGSSAVKLDEELNKIAAVRAKEIAKKYNKDHTRPDGTAWYTAFSDAGYTYVTASENIGYESRGTAESIMEEWMSSKKGHKENILNKDFTKIGVGYCEVDGVYYWVQEFAG